ncbi:BRO1-domain-containing protein [Atractiella rhizophila]|nr:BRO1-domain-containing protein [Atractiella rhizophila]
MAPPKLLIPPTKAPGTLPDVFEKLRDALSTSSPSDPSSHPSALRQPVQDFVNKRDEALRAITGTGAGAGKLQAILSYQAQVAHLCTKLESTAPIPWSYEAIFSTQSSTFGTVRTVQGPISYQCLHYERICVLYNLASLLAQDAGKEKWTNLGFTSAGGSMDAYNRAMEGFQKAAWLFGYLEKTTSDIYNFLPPDVSHPFSPEFSAASLKSMKDLCHALSMEVFWYKYLANVQGFSTKENQILSKIAFHASEYYRSAHAAAKEGKNGSSEEGGAWPGWGFPKEWISLLSAKSAYFEAESQWRKSREDLAANRYGEEITRLEHAARVLSGIQGRKYHPDIVRAIEELRTTIATNLTRANKDNTLIYLQQTPPLSSLPSIDPKNTVRTLVPAKEIPSIAQPLAFLNSNKDGLGAPIFAHLVPWVVHVGIELYMDRLERIRLDWQQHRKEVEGESAKQLADLGLPGSLEAVRLPSSLPPSLLKESEEVRRSGGVEALEKTHQEIKRQAGANMRNLSKTLDLLEKEYEKDEELRERWGERWIRISSEEGSKEHRKQAEELRGKLREAGEVDRMIGRKWSDWEERIAVLSGTEAELKEVVPTGVVRELRHDSASERSVRKLGTYLEDVSSLKEELQNLEAELDVEIGSEDPKVAIEDFLLGKHKDGEELKAADLEPVLEKALKKYRKFEKGLKEVERKQEELLLHIRDANDRFLQTRQEDKTVKAREQALQDLDAAYQKYLELTNEFSQAVKFHNAAARQITNLLNSTNEWYHARMQEARDIESELATHSDKIANLDLNYEEDNEEEESEEESDLEPPPNLPKTLPPASRESSSATKRQLYNPKLHGPPKFASNA